MDTGLVVSATSGAISALLVLGLILSAKFRRDVLGGHGEAAILGVITAKGAAIVVLCALFVAGMLYPLSRSNQECDEAIGRLNAQLAEKFASQIRHAATESDVTALRGIIERLQLSADQIHRTCH